MQAHSVSQFNDMCIVETKIVCHDSSTVDELASIGLAAVNKGFLDVGVQFLQVAKARAAASQQSRLGNLLATAVKVVSDWSTQYCHII